ncbi:S-adenosylmethionine-dependent methyltransferase Rv2258c [Patella vulgata]|uniref:S-adenosylmethionine-dependent methyltransferase Rv2258c n=1 Tax=Patella vulgata TaxID=6465 RepID=UPI00217F8D8D|nr:S-adenosylmethionine-dependent methyltransferase Rv2258c [Patella vulgata]
MAASEYAARLSGYLNGAAACLALSITRESGLLKVFIEPHEPMTIPQIASKTNLKERYIKELLGCLVASSIIEIDEASIKYFLPDELRSTLVRVMNFQALIDFAIQRKEDVKTCLKMDGPKGYSGQSFPRFGEILSNMLCFDLDAVIEDEIFSRTPEVKQKLENGIDFAEFGCGLGPVILELASRYPNSRFIASDYSPQAMATVAKTIEDKGLKNIKAQQADLYQLPDEWVGKFDVVYIRDCLHDMGSPSKGAKGLVKVLKDDGVLLIVEIVIKGDNHRENKEDPMATKCFIPSTTVCVPESLKFQNRILSL